MNATQPISCQHRWFVTEQQGAALKGVCRLCGTRREFPKYPEPLTRTKRGHTGIDLKRGAP